jgi:uncharacterized protein (TIGR04255 family)
LTWQPLHLTTHSIETVTASVVFTEALTDVFWRKAVREGESNANALGLTEKSSVSSIQFAIGQGLPAPVPAPMQPQAPQAIRLSRSLFVEGTEQRFVAETLSIGKLDIAYYTSTYTRWAAFFDRLRSLFTMPLPIALEAVRPQSLRLEYKDSFRYTGEGTPIAETLLREKSPLIAPHVFTQPELFHSHTGMFERSNQSDQRLIQLNIDANEVWVQNEQRQARAVSIMTAVQENFFPRPEDSSWPSADALIGIFDSMHERSSEIFRSVVSDEIGRRIGSIT